MSYVVYMTLEDWLGQIARRDSAIHLQDMQTISRMQGISTAITSMIVATFADESGTVHAARIVIERADLIVGNFTATRRAVAARATEARSAIEQAIQPALASSWNHRDIRPGIMLAPGLRDDLQHYEASQELWTWQGDQRDPVGRRLVQP